MNKQAYNLGVKLALADAGLLTPDSDSALAKLSVHPAEALATILQGTPAAENDPEAEPDEPIGAPKDDHRTFSGSRSGNISSDISAALGLDVRGPEDTSVAM